MPKISVIVPMYNVRDYIEECLRSLQQQTFGDFQAICVDDGSSDDTLNVARNCVAGDDRFEFVSAPCNSGLSATRNRGIDDAAGEYLIFLDSDDYLALDALERLYAKAHEQNLDVLDFTAESFYENHQLRRTHNEDFNHRQGNDEVLSGADLFVWYQKINEFFCPAWLHLVRREFLLESGLRFYEGIIHEDELFSVQLLALAPRAAYMNEAFYRRRVREGSIMTNDRGLRNIQSFMIITNYMDRWIRQHASEYQTGFVDAYVQRIYNLRDLMARDALPIEEKALASYADTLEWDDRIDFDMFVREHAKNVDKIYHEVTDTKTFKVGHALLAFPVWVKSRLSVPS